MAIAFAERAVPVRAAKLAKALLSKPLMTPKTICSQTPSKPAITPRVASVPRSSRLFKVHARVEAIGHGRIPRYIKQGISPPR